MRRLNVEEVILQICGGDTEQQVLNELNLIVLEAFDEAKIGGPFIALPPRGKGFESDSDPCVFLNKEQRYASK